ncbi:outer membrane receptor protein involved in Fe transport [Chryseobacterium sp. 52]|uniref:TonB-dependent receptor domain-containing protein n=1 Tax=Chryseobacterium sp. 52 TaxID=2035213 RepID=UPI000C4554EB|nr:TonB-dependent receptor [Chryseobacterium sp. 52]PIF43276.1 outer membrane receptor protein involved in Fe transport [Chryseobacterium sp. 52]
MTIKLWLSLLLLFLSLFGKAQETVKGKVLDSETKKEIFRAEISVLNESDRRIIQKVQTDSSGFFQLNTIPDGSYLSIQKNDYEIRKLEKTEDFSLIELKPMAENISEVVIRATGRSIKLNDGNIVMSVSGNKDFKTSANLIEVLKKTPGVSIDQEGAIFIGGRITPAIFIDGKPIVMSSQELQAYLRSLPPEMVESIEVNANPSSKYDAEFKGIIDIRLKRNGNLGWKGNYNGNTYINRFSYRENALNLSYNTAKTAYSLQASYNNGISIYKYNALQRLANTNVMQTTTHQEDEGQIYSVQTGADFRINDKNRVGINVRGNFRKNERSRFGSLYTTNKDGSQLIFNTESENPIDYSQENYGLTADYSFQNKGFKLSFLGNYLTVKNKQKDDFINRDQPTTELLSYWKSDMLNNIDIQTAQIDASQKIGNADIEAGIKYSRSDTNNNIRYDTLSVDDRFVFDPERSNMFSYKEKIWAGYLSYRQKFGKLQVNAGLRFENTQSISDAVTRDSIVSRNYLEWLPSFSTTYTFNKTNELSLSYSRKITRPVFSQLNPFRVYYSPLNYWIGNPYLQPSFTSQIKLTYRYKNWVTGVTVGKEKDVMTRYPVYNPETNVLEYLGTNLPYRKFASVETSFPVKLTKWWNVTSQIAGYYNDEFRPYLDEVFALKIYSYELRVNQVFSLPKGYTVNLFANYESKTGNSLYIIKPRYTVDLSVQKSWFNNTLNTKIAYNNIFDSYNQQLEFRHKQIMDNRFTHWWDSSRLIISVAYSFGSSKYQTKDIQKTEEENRAR